MNSNVSAVVTKLAANLTVGVDYSGIGPGPVPDDADFPYLVVREIMQRKLTSHDGPSGVGPCLMQVSCFSKDYEQAFATRMAVDAVLDTLIGDSAGVTSQGVTHNHSHDLYDSERELWQCVTRYEVWFETERV